MKPETSERGHLSDAYRGARWFPTRDEPFDLRQFTLFNRCPHSSPVTSAQSEQLWIIFQVRISSFAFLVHSTRIDSNAK